jgi:hypothetical protein
MSFSTFCPLSDANIGGLAALDNASLARMCSNKGERRNVTRRRDEPSARRALVSGREL